ncbi:sodium-coupled monocarboxylate transporter 1-like [Lutzomyia longipalpis]|uniref:sodium-coupled monocarboxylate transporter 1-like n=1 Tax=Lutzomyia longipalpis TaxID=7200 RepID=UPI002483BEED|nr:sodium-coupled monocarboxylate transporter 1-like [Lutzomyia longipalpis]
MYANYETCDPFRAGFIEKIDQILPYFIQERASLFLGFNGIFIAGIFSASLSTTSSYLNAMSGIIYEDFITNKFPGIKEQRAGRIIKGTVFLLALLQIGLVLFIEKMGSIVQMVSQCISLNASALLTLFILGALVPKANSTGAQLGALAGIISVLTFMIGSLNNKVEPMLTLRIDGCDAALNNSSNLFQILENSSNTGIADEESWPFKLSFVYYGLIGSIPGIAVGYLVVES